MSSAPLSAPPCPPLASSPAQHWGGRLAGCLWWGLILLACALNAQRTLAGGNPWGTGDWLINYQGGLVRRGVPGDLLWHLTSSATGLLWSVWALQTALLVGLGARIWQLRHRLASSQSANWMLLLSPAFLAGFTAMDLSGGFRKELLGFAAYLVLDHALSTARLHRAMAMLALAAYAIAALAHEVNALCLVFFLHPIWLAARQRPDERQTLKMLGAGFTLIAVAGLLLSILKPGSATTVSLICQSLQQHGLNEAMCSGAVKWLQFDVVYGLRQVRRILLFSVLGYPWLIVLGLLPVFLYQGWAQRRTLLGLGALSLLPLFIVATDWGRWVHVLVAYMTLSLLSVARTVPLRARPVPLVLALVFILAWRLPHYNAEDIYAGVLWQGVQSLVSGAPAHP